VRAAAARLFHSAPSANGIERLMNQDSVGSRRASPTCHWQRIDQRGADACDEHGTPSIGVDMAWREPVISLCGAIWLDRS
jgi:hypothetical protein